MSRIRPAKFVHVVYRTRRFEQMICWYETVFDARIQHQNPALAFLTHDDEHHRFALAGMKALGFDAVIYLALPTVADAVSDVRAAPMALP